MKVLSSQMLMFCLCVGSASAAGLLAKSRRHAPTTDMDWFRYDMFPSERQFPRGRHQGPNFPTQFEEKGTAPGWQRAGGRDVKVYQQEFGRHFHEPGKVPTFAEYQDEEEERKYGEQQEKAQNPQMWAKEQTKKREHELERQEQDAEWALWRQKHGKMTRQEREQKEEAEAKPQENPSVGMVQQSDEDDAQARAKKKAAEDDARARKKLFATAKATKNCRILDNPVSVFMCKEELENEENTEISTAEASHNCGKLPSPQEISLCLDRQKHDAAVRLNEMPLAGDQDNNGYDEQAMNVPRKDLARWGETKMSNEEMDH